MVTVGDVVCREMLAEDVPAALALRNDVFHSSLIAAEDWARDEMLASIAILNGQVVGAIPMVMRDLVIAPGVTVRAPFENAVGTRADLRGRGIGSKMVAAAREFLRGRADGLFVYRGVERSDGYRFYVKTGHHDLMYARRYQMAAPAPARLAPDATILGTEEITSSEDQLLPIFHSTYGQFGGFPRRTRGYYRRALASSIFSAIPANHHLVRVADGDAPAGYAILQVRTGQRADSAVHIIETATRSASLAVARRVLAAVVAFAGERQLAISIRATDEDPFVPALQSWGFETPARSDMIMGQVIDAPDLFERCWRERLHFDGAGLRVWTPQQDHVLVEPHPGYPTLTLEMKEETLHRWLLGRIDLAARIREGTVTCFGADEGALRALCAAIPYTPWAYHYLDWI